MNTAFADVLRFEWGALTEYRSVKLVQIHAIRIFWGRGDGLSPAIKQHE